MQDSFTEVQHRSWFSRVGQSLKNLLIGLLLLIIAFPLLFWNEGRAVHRSKTLKEGQGVVVTIAANNTSPEHDGALVHMTGTATTEETLTDSVFGVSVRSALKLRRTVEVYQWQEHAEESRTTKAGGGEEVTTTYSYDKAWSPTLTSSKQFKKPEGHTNPERKPFPNQTQPAGNVTIGSYKLTDTLLAKVNPFTPIPLTEMMLENLSTDLVARTHLEDSRFYIGQNPSAPDIGDARVWFESVPPTEISLVSKRIGTTFEPWTSRYGTLELLQLGQQDAATMFADARRSNTLWTWLIRLGGFLLMALGFKVLLEPLAVLADVIPFLGTVLRAGTGFVSLLVAFVLSIVTIAFAWIVYRPLLGIALLVLAGGGWVAGMSAAKKRSAGSSGAPPPPPHPPS